MCVCGLFEYPIKQAIRQGVGYSPISCLSWTRQTKQSDHAASTSIAYEGFALSTHMHAQCWLKTLELMETNAYALNWVLAPVGVKSSIQQVYHVSLIT